MKKQRKKNGAKLIDNKVQLALIITLLVLLVIFGGAVALTIFADLPEGWQKWLALLTGSVDALSVFLVPVLSIWITSRVIRSKNRLEEDLKIEPDHHKIICQYNKHSREFIDYKSSPEKAYNKDGVIMSLCNVTGEGAYNPVSDVHGEAYFERQREINFYKNGRLLLPSVNVFANIDKATIVIEDSKTKYPMPSFLQENASKLLSAHKASNVTNGKTIRLKDFKYEDSTLTLKTERSDYIQMLMTNRCMDFDIDGMSVRTLYEHGAKVSPLHDSKLCNQIGINGLVLTNDGYLLIEKRGRKKAVWKNKFAQPISLALKLNDIDTNDGLIGTTPADAEKCFKKVVSKTLRSNFGLNVCDGNGEGDYEFVLSKNFMGIARDLLEGGKPNLYFYVSINMSAAELKNYLEINSQLAVRVSEARGSLSLGVDSAKRNNNHETYLSGISEEYKKELKQLISEGYLTVAESDGKDLLKLKSVKHVTADADVSEIIARLDKMSQCDVDKCLGDILLLLPKVNKDKLESRFYLIKREDIKLDYNYATSVPTNKTLGIQRMYYPCVSKLKEKRETARVNTPRRKNLHYECGEALLASLYYATILDLEKR